MYAPSNATEDSRFPVFFFIQGGGFNSNSNGNLSGSELVVASNYSIVVTTINYRVGPYGFLPTADGANNGLRDQRAALEWVQAHIASFGGDPGHVVLGGASAGAASVSLHLTAEGGKDRGLFHAAAAESVSFATVLTRDQAQYQLNNFALRAGCTGSNPVPCLRTKSYSQLQAVNRAIPYPGAKGVPLYMWNPVVDGDFIRDLTYVAFSKGRFIKVPIIFGDDTNGGTIFVPRSTSTLEQSNGFLRNNFPYLTPTMFNRINNLYPNPNTSCPKTGCFWRQGSNVYGEMRYTCPGLVINSVASRNGVPQSYAYRWNVEDPDQIAKGFGVPHCAELNAIFGPHSTNGNSPKSYYPGGKNAQAVAVIQAYWISFIKTFNPNTHRYPGSAVWDSWTDANQSRLLFDTGGNTSMERIDDGLKKRCCFLVQIGAAVQQ